MHECWREKVEDERDEIRDNRESYYNINRYSSSEIERIRERGRQIRGELVIRNRDVQKQERGYELNSTDTTLHIRLSW